MAFPVEILRAGILIADGLTKGVQGTITIHQCTGTNGVGVKTYASPISVRAVIDRTQKQKATSTGKMVIVIATLTILEAVPSNGTAGRQEPIDPRDKIVLPDGTTGPIFQVPNAVHDPGTGKPLINEVMLAAVNAS